VSDTDHEYLRHEHELNLELKNEQDQQLGFNDHESNFLYFFIRLSFSRFVEMIFT